jgi:predicted metal-dependent phosphoesterase TrpH
MTFRADLHCHSTFSDGTFTPKELIELAEEKGLNALSITDHDCIGAYSEALSLAKKKGLLTLPGAEFSATFEEHSVHVLAYSFDFTSPSLIAFCRAHADRRKERNEEILSKLRKNGFALSMEELDQHSSRVIGRPHIAEALVKKGYLKDTLTAFRYFLGEGKSCFALGPEISVEKTLEAIHKAKGLAVLAHPHLLRNKKRVERLLRLPFDGIECLYALMTPLQNHPWLELAARKNLLVSGGSDFHGRAKPQVPLGAATLEQTYFEPFYNHFQSCHGHLLATA